MVTDPVTVLLGQVTPSMLWLMISWPERTLPLLPQAAP